MIKINIKLIPKKVLFCIEELQKKNFEAYIVGGCTRDLLRGAEPNDWDITTNATPEEIQAVFIDKNIKTFYENDFGTVGVAFPLKQEGFEIVEITTYRNEAIYSDNRHPDKVTWSKTIDEDLKRRDFTINAIAITPKNGIFEMIDLFEGQKDIKNKIIRTVNKPNDRFSEDALRMMRAIRLEAVLGFDWKIEQKTLNAIKNNAKLLKNISKERIRDELIKIIMSENAVKGIESLRNSGLLTYILPELEEGCEIKQNKHHIYDCYRHNLESLAYSIKKNFDFDVRMAALLHDIGKPRTKRGLGSSATFYNHEIVGAKMTEKIVDRLKLPKKEAKSIVNLVRHHLFYYNVDEVGESSVRRLVKNVGLENVEKLLQLRMCDRIGSGCPKAEPYKIRHLKYMIEKVSKDPISVKMLKIDGKEVMETLKLKPSPKIGMILDILLEEVLNEPKRNNKRYLKKRLVEISKLDEKMMEKLAKEAKMTKTEVVLRKDKETKEKYWVS